MKQPIISIQNLSKEYRIGSKEQYYSLRDSLTKVFQRRSKTKPFWALKDVSADIYTGEAVGVIGRNGAGKSTLLKILSQITPPTSGKITMRGRVASLLEVGTGFHPELTGRENIFLNGAILGMTRREITRKFDEIVAFAEIEKFLDTPVKRYSSGMYVRLAFAVAAHLEPEILIVDEVLAVGDAGFQKKCLGRMEEVGKEGRTVIFVSHNMGAIRQLCSRGILLEKGHATSYDSVETLINAYQNQLSTVAGSNEIVVPNGDISFNHLQLNGADLNQTPDIISGDPLVITLDYHSKVPNGDLCIGWGITAKKDGNLLAYTHNHLEDVHHRTKTHGKVITTLSLPKLAPGSYGLDISVWIDGHHYLNNEEVGQFTITETPAFGTGISVATFPSALLISSEWEFKA